MCPYSIFSTIYFQPNISKPKLIIPPKTLNLLTTTISLNYNSHLFIFTCTFIESQSHNSQLKHNTNSMTSSFQLFTLTTYITYSHILPIPNDNRFQTLLNNLMRTLQISIPEETQESNPLLPLQIILDHTTRNFL